jgi:hypothetical protein
MFGAQLLHWSSEVGPTPTGSEEPTMSAELSRWWHDHRSEDREQLRRWANTQRLEGNYVAAQTTERILVQLEQPGERPRL